MILSRARVAAGIGAVVLLIAAYPLLGMIQRAGDLSNFVFLPILVVYMVGAILAGGAFGLWFYRRLDWTTRASHQYAGLIIGAAFGVWAFAGEGWAMVGLAAGLVGLIGVAAGSIFWWLDRTVNEPVRPPYSP
jgi:hypothetical protein